MELSKGILNGYLKDFKKDKAYEIHHLQRFLHICNLKKIIKA